MLHVIKHSRDGFLWRIKMPASWLEGGTHPAQWKLWILASDLILFLPLSPH